MKPNDKNEPINQAPPSDPVEQDTQKNPLTAKKIALFVLYAIIAACLLMTVLSFNDLPGIMEQLKTVDFRYVLLAMLMVLIYMALYPLSLCILTKARGCHIGMPTTYCIAMTEHFFNGITPLATGGQPFQAHEYSRAKVKISESTGLLLTNLLIYMAVTTGFSLVGLAYFNVYTSTAEPWWISIIIVGYSLNFFVLVAILILGTSRKIRDLLMRFIYFVCKFRLFKRFESKAEDLRLYFEQVQQAFADLTKKKGAFALATITKIFSFAFLYASTFFILLSMNVDMRIEHLPLALLGTCFAVTAVGFIPTPGASGGVEGSAGQVLKSIIVFVMGDTILSSAANMANGVMLIWRLLSYYFVMAISLLFYVALEIYFARKQKKQITDLPQKSDP